MSLPELIRAERILKDDRGVHMVVKDSLDFSYNKKKKYLNKLDYSVYFNKNVFTRKNDLFIYSSILVNNFFRITLTSILPIIEKIIISHLRGKYLAITRLLYDIYT